MKKILILGLVISMALLGGCAWSVGKLGVISGDRYDDAASYQIGSFSYAAQAITKVNVNWRSGRVEIIESDAEELSVSESGRSLNDAAAMHYLLKDGVLNIQFCASGANVTVLSTNKQLRLEVPRGVEISVQTTSAPIVADTLEAKDVFAASHSGDISFGSVQAGEIELSSSSGKIHAERTIADSVSCETASGTIDLGALEAAYAAIHSSSGKLCCDSVAVDALEAKTSSGSITLHDISESSVNIESSSGSVELAVSEKSSLSVCTSSGSVALTLPQAGAEVRHSAASGRLKTNAVYLKSGDTYIFGEGESAVDVRSSSGSLRITVS